jgi:hypothetical protein
MIYLPRYASTLSNPDLYIPFIQGILKVNGSSEIIHNMGE